MQRTTSRIVDFSHTLDTARAAKRAYFHAHILRTRLEAQGNGDSGKMKDRTQFESPKTGGKKSRLQSRERLSARCINSCLYRVSSEFVLYRRKDGRLRGAKVLSLGTPAGSLLHSCNKIVKEQRHMSLKTKLQKYR